MLILYIICNYFNLNWFGFLLQTWLFLPVYKQDEPVYCMDNFLDLSSTASLLKVKKREKN